MINKNTFTLINPQNGNLAFKLFSFDNNNFFDHIQRLNYYSLIWIKQGHGQVKVDFYEYDFSENQLLAFAPYQPFMLSNAAEIKGTAIHFHPDFFCIIKHHQEVACNGVLFNNIYEPPYVNLDEIAQSTFNMALESIKIEMQNSDLAQYELLTSYLKIILITASRLKKEQQPKEIVKADKNETPFILQNLKNYIELHFKTKHSASEYADLLNITPKALATITKNHFNKTLTNLIAERIIIEAKRELYLTNKAVKEIAFELGYNDEHYFSRFFKNNADVSPQVYRETVGFARGIN
ncbi:helix-turn-helix transcriptional regulator [Flavobacterium plurextorum]|uniref:helix-turn-helix transcriptional regulator n=1 Tax=Flavobacterium TaxID=237 RepID=UPI00214DD1E0|nr:MULTISPECIES: helix-turn-helix transcriptional regulator [Flavobacterium]UUW08424.1 helix-turn-helix transcriptional regulator [Flavobacterium plurextorum]